MKRGSFIELGRNLRAMLESIGVHLVFGLVLVFGLSHSNAREIRRPPVITATIVDMNQLKADRQAAQQAARQAELDQARKQASARRRTEQQLREAQRRKQESAEQKKRERDRLAKLDSQQREREQQQRQEQVRADELRRKREQIAAERKRLQDETKKQQQAAADARAADEADLMREMLAREEAGRESEARATKRQQWEGMVRQLVEQNWRRPPTAAQELICVVNIRLVPGGDVTDVALGDCRLDTSTERSIKDAVMRSSPLPWEGFEDVAPRAFGFRFCAQETACERN